MSKAAVEAAELNMVLEESISIRRNELKDSLKEIEEVFMYVCMYVNTNKNVSMPTRP